MSSRVRSSSMGAIPLPKKHFTSRAESTAATALDVRCACQFFQSDSLLPERINPVGSRPSSREGYYSRPISSDLTHHVFEPDYIDPESQRKFSFGVVASTDYYSESMLSRPNSPPRSNVADTSTSNSQQNLNLLSNLEPSLLNTSLNVSTLQKDPSQSVLLQNNMDTLRQKDPSTSVLLRRRSESTHKNLENAGRQRDPSTSSILRRRFSEKNVNNIQQRDPSTSSLLRRRLDSQGSLRPQSSIEEPAAKEPKLRDSTASSDMPHESIREPQTNAERFMLSKNTLQMKPSIELSDLYRETMTFSEMEKQNQSQSSPKTIDVGIIDLMTLGTSFIQKGEIKGKKKTNKDKTNVNETTEDVLDEPQELATTTQTTLSPTNTALVHIGQNIYIEEPDAAKNESIALTKNERLSRRDYPDKVSKNIDNPQESVAMLQKPKKNVPADDIETMEPISSTLLPRDLREQSIFTTDSQKMKSQNSIILKEAPSSECVKQRDVSTSSLLRKRYNQNYTSDSPQSTDQQITSSPVATFVKQREPSSSSLLRKRYHQNPDNQATADGCISTEMKEQYIDPSLNSIDLIDKKTVCFENDNDVADFKERDTIRALSENREKMDWIEGTYNTRDHEYEPIGESIETVPSQTTSLQQDLPLPTIPVSDENNKGNIQEDNSADASSITSHERKLLRSSTVADDEEEIQNMQDRIEERFFAPTPQTDHSRNDEICTSQVDSSAIENLPLRREDRKKGFMASTTDKTRNVHRKLSKQADRLKTKLKEMQKPKPEESPKSERKRFRSPEFNKLKNIKMPKISKPDLKRPEFTKFKKPDFKFTKPDMAFLKKYDGFSSLRLNRKKSNTTETTDSFSNESKITRTTDDVPVPTKKRFDFGTYPRIFDRMRRDNRSGGGGTTISRDTEPEEECDRITGPIQFATVPRSTKEKNPIRSKWASNVSSADDESGKFKHYSLDRETSVEKRMRLDFKDSIDVEEDDQELGILQTDEQRQFADYDKENRAIHEISKAKEGEFKQRRPLVHQESDVVSEVSNKEFGWVDTDHLRNRLMTQSGDLDISQKEEYVNDELPEKDHLSTQETQSSGSSSNRRRTGVIEEVDDDEFWLRKKGISQDDIQIGRYISAAIREGLDTPVNALAQLGQYDSYYDEDFDISNERVDYGYDVPPRKPRRVKDFEKSLESGEFNEEGITSYSNEEDEEDLAMRRDDQFFRTYPPSRPHRKTRKQPSDESHDEHEIPVAAQYYPHPDEDDHSFYENKQMEGIEQPDIKITYNEDSKSDFDIKFASNEDQIPPKAPKRRKHLLRESMERDSPANNFVGRSISNSYLTNGNAEETIVFRTEHEYFVPLVQPETFTTPTPTPRSRSKISPLTDDDRTSRGAESLAFDDTKFSADIKDINGYAVVKKEPPPRPPAPVRRKRSTRSLGDRQFFTMPLRKNQIDVAPERPVRNYSTIGPTRPARRVSLTSLEKPPSVTSDATQYEEIEDINNFGNADSKDRKTDQNYKMKHRPLPPPPRPPRERKHRKSSESDGNKLDKDGGGEKIVSKKILEDISRISSQEMEEIEEMERSTQTDPLPEDYLCEEFDINSDMPIIEPSFNRHSKTLEDILKEEQQAELERARQIADENSLTKGIQKFREANQRSLSERSRGSTNDRPKTPSSRPITPSAAVVIERKISLSTIQTDAQLIVQPVDEDATDYTRGNRFYAEDTVDTEDERIVNEALKRYNLLDSDFRDSSPVSNIERPHMELNIREVEPIEVPQEQPNEPPQAPPRRRSSCTESTVVPTVNQNENAPIPEEHIDIETHDTPLNLLQGNRLHINELEVDHLNVHALQAGRILVSDLQAIAISSQDIECTSGDLTVKGIKLPPGFIEELINQARAREIEDHSRDQHDPSQVSQETTEVQQPPIIEPQELQKSAANNETTEEPEPPARPPPPRSLYPSDYAHYSLPPPSFYQLRAYPDEIEDVLPHSQTVHRRRRHHRRHDSTSEEEEQREHRRNRQHSNRSPEPSIGDLSGQLIRACGSAIGRTGVKLYAVMKEKKQEMKRRDISIGVAILILIVAFLMIVGLGGERTVHHHHWDYLNPPDNSGRP